MADPSSAPERIVMPADVFLSYCRSSSATHARSVREILVARGVSAFLDESDIELGERFPESLVDALLGAKVVVVFADETYFTRWYCLWEWRVARTPFLAAIERAASTRDREAALSGLVLALSPQGRSASLDHLPPVLRQHNWPSAGESEAVASAVLTRLASGAVRLSARLDALPETGGASVVRWQMLDVVRLPPARSLRGVPRAPLMLPQSIGERFVGRADDLWRIDDLLVTRGAGTPGGAALTGALTAMGGVGKSRIALEYVHRLGPARFPGGIFWIDAEQSASLVETRHHEILQALVRDAPPLQVYRDAASGRNLARDLIQAIEALPSDHPVLVVIDNVPEPDAESGSPALSLENWWPAPGVTAVLVTSRFDLSFASGGTIAPLPIDVIDRRSAVALLTSPIGIRAALQEEEWDEIAQWVGDLPLVLTLLNAAMRAGALEPSTLLARARANESATQASDSAMHALQGHVVTGSQHAMYRGVTEAMLISYERLAPAPRNAARLLACLAPAPVPSAVLDALPHVFTPAVRVALTTRSFVTPFGAGEPRLFGTMHRVLAGFLRRQAEQDECTTQFATAARGALLGVITPDRCHDPGAWALMRTCAPHAEHLLESEAEDDPTSAEQVVTLALRLGLYFWAQGQSDRARAVEERAMELASKRLGLEHAKTLESMHNLAGTLLDLGDLRGARTLQERVVDARTRTLGREHPDTLTGLNNLARTLFESGDVSGAHEILQRVRKPHIRVLGPEHLHTLIMLGNLGEVLSARGDLIGAQRLLKRVVDAETRTLGPENPETLRSVYALALVLGARGDRAGARSLLMEVHSMQVRLLGREHKHAVASAEAILRFVD